MRAVFKPHFLAIVPAGAGAATGTRAAFNLGRADCGVL